MLPILLPSLPRVRNNVCVALNRPRGDGFEYQAYEGMDGIRKLVWYSRAPREPPGYFFARGPIRCVPHRCLT